MKTLLLAVLTTALLLACAATNVDSSTAKSGATQVDPVAIRLAAGGVT